MNIFEATKTGNVCDVCLPFLTAAKASMARPGAGSWDRWPQWPEPDSVLAGTDGSNLAHSDGIAGGSALPVRRCLGGVLVQLGLQGSLPDDSLLRSHLANRCVTSHASHRTDVLYEKSDRLVLTAT